MKNTLTVVLSTLALFVFASTSFGFITADVEYFDFSGWDHAQITSGGQTFNDVYGDVDVTVTSVGNFDLSTGYGGGWVNTGGHVTPGSHSLRFSFSEQIPTVVKFETVDSEETISVYNSGNESYCHIGGASPMVTYPTGGVMVQGDGMGISAIGAASGQIITSGGFLTVTHGALAANKFERVMIGTIVPEPNSFGLLAIGGLAMLRRRRRK